MDLYIPFVFRNNRCSTWYCTFLYCNVCFRNHIRWKRFQISLYFYRFSWYFTFFCLKLKRKEPLGCNCTYVPINLRRYSRSVLVNYITVNFKVVGVILRDSSINFKDLTRDFICRIPFIWKQRNFSTFSTFFYFIGRLTDIAGLFIDRFENFYNAVILPESMYQQLVIAFVKSHS